MTTITLDVEDFSCIRKASIRLAPLSVLIGPQASGKSLLSKLIYYFNSVVIEHRTADGHSTSFDAWKTSLRDRFDEWFPSTAWGSGKFRIEYSVGKYVVRFIRSSYNNQLTDNIRVWTSAEVEDFHSNAGKLRREFLRRPDAQDELDWEAQSKIDIAVRDLFAKTFSPDAWLTQLFIPAGRSFFTSAGKAVTAFEHARLFDPVTLAFGKRLAAYRDRGFESAVRARGALLRRAGSILGGQVSSDRNGEYLKTEDGRKIPFGSLSSGQQELLPLLMVLDSIYGSRPRGLRFLCIEEPEAHLFPSAQSSVVELIASFVQQVPQNRILLTTHSPYILSKINNLIYAGELGAHANISSDVAQVVGTRTWLPRPLVHAYAMQEGAVRSIIDDDTGLIAADYLDDVSGVIAKEFNRLLAIGAAHDLV